MEHCGSCEGEIEVDKVKAIIRCTDCKSIYHIECTKIVPQNFTKMGARKSTWKCHFCKSSAKKLLEEMSCDVKEMKEAIGKLTIRIDNAEQKLSDVENKTDKNSSNINTIKNDQGNIVAGLRSIEKENEDLKSQIEEINKDFGLRIAELEQRFRIQNVEIMGIPVTPKENCSAIVLKVASLVGLSIKEKDVQVAHRVRSRIQGRIPSIIAHLSSRTIKKNFVRASRERKLVSRDIHQQFSEDTKVFVYEHLTPDNKALLSRTREVATKFKYIWTDDGKILVRKNDNKKAIWVRKPEDLQLVKIANDEENDAVAKDVKEGNKEETT